ncbi:MAG TPA: TonB family protein [Vicinamibacterales bacterium]|nr:TonB family protein [Vicinamibacterales bacterium]
MDVTDVLRDRMHEPAGLQRMVAVSLAAHAVIGTLIVLSPGQFFGHRTQEQKSVMTITLGGGGEGQRTQGLTSIGGRPVQVETPPEEKPKREAVRTPAAKQPEMTLPAKDTRPTKAAPAPKVEQAPEGAKGRTPTKGSKVEFGSSVAVTGAKGQGFGLASGGGAGSGSSLDVSDFCCPDYIVLMMERVRSAWMPNQGARGEVYIHFNIHRNGSITDARIDASSGNPLLDNAALRAIISTRSLPPLPDQYSNPTLGVRLQFIYQ